MIEIPEGVSQVLNCVTCCKRSCLNSVVIIDIIPNSYQSILQYIPIFKCLGLEWQLVVICEDSNFCFKCHIVIMLLIIYLFLLIFK